MDFALPQEQLFIASFIAIIGLVFGSFVTMLSHRLPYNRDIVFDRSHCPICNYSLKFFDLIPIFSWLCSFGRCKNCKSEVSIR